MKKQLLFIPVILLLALGSNLQCMELNYGNKLPQPEAYALARNPFQPTYNQDQIDHAQEALFLLRQHYFNAQQTGTYLPYYFFTNLEHFKRQVPAGNTKLLRDFGALQQMAAQINEDELPSTDSLE